MGWCVLDDLCRSSVISCSETKKPPWKVVFKDSSELELFRIKVTGSSREQSPKVPFQFSQQWCFCSRLFPRNSCYPRLSPWRFVVPERIGLQEIVAVLGSESRCERGDSAYTPNAQRRTSAQIQTQAGNEKTGLNPLKGIESG